jgi:hypothetical protein
MRKIKCDGQKPKCTHCVIYTMDCTYAAPSRRSKPKRRKTATRSEEQSSDDIRDRVQHLEKLLEQLVEPPATNKQTAVLDPQPSQDLDLMTPAATVCEDGSPCLSNDDGRSLHLAPPGEVLPILQNYLHNANTLLPIFDSQCLLQCVYDFYAASPRERKPTAWAAINIALALAHRHLGRTSDDYARAEVYESNAQSVFSAVVLSETHLLNVQVALGMTMLSMCRQDFSAALILIATTVSAPSFSIS